MKSIKLITLSLLSLTTFASIDIDICVLEFDEYTYQKRVLDREERKYKNLEDELNSEREAIVKLTKNLQDAKDRCFNKRDLDGCIAIDAYEGMIEKTKEIVSDLSDKYFDMGMSIGRKKSKLIYKEMSMGICAPQNEEVRANTIKQCDLLNLTDSYYCREVTQGNF